MLTADEIFEATKPERIWLLLSQIFEVIAMHDVKVIKSKIFSWINDVWGVFKPNSTVQVKKIEDAYLRFQTGILPFYIFKLYVKEESFEPDSKNMYEYPQNRKEYLTNLTYIVRIKYHINVPIYMIPEDYLDLYEPNFLML